MVSSRYAKKVYRNCSEDDEIFILHLGRFSKIAAQYFYRLHQKRSRNLGVYDLDLPMEILPDGSLKILQSDFRNLEAHFLRNIIANPDSIYDVINRRRIALKELKEKSLEAEKILIRGEQWKSNPLSVFEAGTNFSSFYLEYYFPYDFFEGMLTSRLHYTSTESEDLILKLMTPEYIAHLDYYKNLLEMASDWKLGGKIDFDKFRREYAFLGNQDLKEDRLKTDADIEKYLRNLIKEKEPTSIFSKIDEIESKSDVVRRSHNRIRNEIHERASQAKLTIKLAVGLVDLLIDTGLENEENHYWRNRTFAYFRNLAIKCGLDFRAISIEELSEKARSSQSIALSH